VIFFLVVLICFIDGQQISEMIKTDRNMFKLCAIVCKNTILTLVHLTFLGPCIITYFYSNTK